MGWNNPPINFSFEVLKDADTLTKKITGEIAQGVIVASPKDTGQFIQNWRVGVSSVNGLVDDCVDPNRTPTIMRNLSAIASGGGIGKLVYISNSLPYARKLNDGHSKQAPMNFVELTMQEVLNKYR